MLKKAILLRMTFKSKFWKIRKQSGCSRSKRRNDLKIKKRRGRPSEADAVQDYWAAAARVCPVTTSNALWSTRWWATFPRVPTANWEKGRAKKSNRLHICWVRKRNRVQRRNRFCLFAILFSYAQHQGKKTEDVVVDGYD